MLQIDVCPAIAHTLHTQIACCWRLSAACEWLWLLRPSLACSTYDAAFCYRQSSLVCRSVWMQRSRVHVRESCKTAEPIEMPFGDDSGGPKEPCMMYYMGSRCPTVGGNFWGLSGSFQSVVSLYCVHCSKKINNAISCAVHSSFNNGSLCDAAIRQNSLTTLVVFSTFLRVKIQNN